MNTNFRSMLGNTHKTGRRSLVDENQRRMLLENMLFAKKDVEKLERKIKRKRHSVLDQMTYLALMGNDKIICEIFKRLFPEPKTKDENAYEVVLAQIREAFFSEPKEIKAQTLNLLNNPQNQEKVENNEPNNK